MIIGITYLKYTLIPHTRFQHVHSGVRSSSRRSSIHSFWDYNIPQWLFKTDENITLLKLAWQFGFKCSGSNIFTDTGCINEKHCSAERAPRELLSIMSRHDTGKAQALSQRSKKEDKTLLHLCLPLVSFPFPVGTGLALWDSSGNGSGARGVQLLNPCLGYKQCLLQREQTSNLSPRGSIHLVTRRNPGPQQHPTQARFPPWYHARKCSQRGKPPLTSHCPALPQQHTAQYMQVTNSSSHIYTRRSVLHQTLLLQSSLLVTTFPISAI